jgi:hypothetical protein
MKDTILIALAIIAFIVAFSLYDMANDASAHTCVQACTIDGCPFDK